jgi:type II secretory pathway component PulF
VSDLASFSSSLALAIERGLPLIQALPLASTQASSPAFRAAVDSVTRQVAEGSPLEPAFRHHAEFFPDDFCALVGVGESGGRLAEVLRRGETGERLRARLRAHTRRVFLYIAAGILLIGFVTSVFPFTARKLGIIYRQIGLAELPVSARLAFWLTENVWVLPTITITTLLALLSFFPLVRWIGGSTRLAYWVPVWGGYQRARDLALACFTLAMRLTSAPAPDSLRAAQSVTRRGPIRRALGLAATRVEGGETLSTAMFYARAFPRTLAWAVSVGEKRNDVPGTIDLFAGIYEREAEKQFELMILILTPISIILLGGFVFIAMGAIFLPMANLGMRM